METKLFQDNFSAGEAWVCLFDVCNAVILFDGVHSHLPCHMWRLRCCLGSCASVQAINAFFLHDTLHEGKGKMCKNNVSYVAQKVSRQLWACLDVFTQVMGMLSSQAFLVVHLLTDLTWCMCRPRNPRKCISNLIFSHVSFFHSMCVFK